MEEMTARPADRTAVRLRPGPAEVRLGERALGVTRVLLAIAALFVAYALQPEQTGAVRGLLALYAAVSVVLLLVIVARSHLPRSLPAMAQTIDVAFAAALALFPVGDTVPFFSFLLFPLLTAAARWGFQEVMITTVFIEAVIVADTLLDPAMLPKTFLPRLVAIAAAGAAIGYQSEQQRRRRFEDRALAVVLDRARLRGTLSETVNVVLGSVRSALRARQVLAVFRERETGRVLVWRTLATETDGASARPVQVPASRHADYWFEAEGTAWHAWVRPFSRRVWGVVALDDRGDRLPLDDLDVPDGFLATHACRRLIGASLQLSDDLECRLLVLDPGPGVHREQSARFAMQIVQRVGPALYDIYMVRSLRTRARALERARIGREMHDGVTQSLLGLEMEIAVLRRRAKLEAPAFDEDLARVHGIVRDEVVTVRELMEGIRVEDVGTGDLTQHLSGVVDRFSRYTGIAARFVSDGQPAPLSPNARRQVARIVHEALVNVRKHSAADRVLVRADVDGAAWKLSIEDDGRGFPFAGRLTLEELEAQRQGPRTIGERARIIGALLTVESRPGFGSRLEVAVPLQPAT